MVWWYNQNEKTINMLHIYGIYCNEDNIFRVIVFVIVHHPASYRVGELSTWLWTNNNRHSTTHLNPKRAGTELSRFN